jgi:Recombinase
MSEKTGGERSIEILEDTILVALDHYFELRRSEIEERKGSVGSGFGDYEEARRQLAEVEQDLEELRRRTEELKAEALGAVMGDEEASKLEEEVSVFYMVGIEGKSLSSVAKTLEQEGVPRPKGVRRWDRSFFRACIVDDVYKPHSFEVVRAIVSPEVAARLDPEKRYGIWWFNRRGLDIRQVSEFHPNSRHYRKTYRWHHKPKEEQLERRFRTTAGPTVGQQRSV